MSAPQKISIKAKWGSADKHRDRRRFGRLLLDEIVYLDEEEGIKLFFTRSGFGHVVSVRMSDAKNGPVKFEVVETK